MAARRSRLRKAGAAVGARGQFSHVADALRQGHHRSAVVAEQVAQLTGGVSSGVVRVEREEDAGLSL